MYVYNLYLNCHVFEMCYVLYGKEVNSSIAYYIVIVYFVHIVENLRSTGMKK